MTQYYEAHITILQDCDRDYIKKRVEEIGWKFSAIDGDPVLGKKVYCYATKHFKKDLGQPEAVFRLMKAADMLDDYIRVIRRKIELVVFDDRQGDCATCPAGLTL